MAKFQALVAVEQIFDSAIRDLKHFDAEFATIVVFLGL